jgi:hypothetical protein
MYLPRIGSEHRLRRLRIRLKIGTEDLAREVHGALYETASMELSQRTMVPAMDVKLF